MDDLSFSAMMAMQQELWQAHSDKWTPLTPEHGRERLLYLFEETGEVISILKKKGDAAVMEDGAVRAHFLEEWSDVLMYLTDTLLCYGVTPGEIAGAYAAKHRRNMGRDYTGEYSGKYED